MSAAPGGVYRHVGVTLQDARDGDGVVVTKTVAEDGAHVEGMRVGDVIRTINGMPAVHHASVVEVIDACTVEGAEMTLVVLSSTACCTRRRRHQHRAMTLFNVFC